MILIWAGAFRWMSTVLIDDAISWACLLDISTLSSLLYIKHLSAMLDPAVGVGRGPGPGPVSTLRLLAQAEIVSHCLAGVDSDFGYGTGCGLGCCVNRSLRFGCICFPHQICMLRGL